MNVNDRKFLMELRDRAEGYAKDVPNHHWKHAFNELAMAADRCDAMIARTCATEITEAA